MSEPEQKEYMWYDPTGDIMIPLQWDLATIAFECARGNHPPGIAHVEVSDYYRQGRLVRADGAVLEYLGEV